MASQAPIPPPLPRPRRSMAGPFVMIVLGILLLLANMGKLPWQTLATWFAHYWPVLIIVWGIIKLVEHQQAQRQGLRPPGIGVGGVFLLIVLIVFGLAATQGAGGLYLTYTVATAPVAFNQTGVRDFCSNEDAVVQFAPGAAGAAPVGQGGCVSPAFQPLQ